MDRTRTSSLARPSYQASSLLTVWKNRPLPLMLSPSGGEDTTTCRGRSQSSGVKTRVAGDADISGGPKSLWTAMATSWGRRPFQNDLIRGRFAVADAEEVAAGAHRHADDIRVAGGDGLDNLRFGPPDRFVTVGVGAGR